MPADSRFPWSASRSPEPAPGGVPGRHRSPAPGPRPSPSSAPRVDPGLPEFLLCLLGGPFAVLDRFERFLGLERALGRETGSLLGLRLAGLDLRLVPSERRLPVGEAFGPRVEFRPLGPEVRFFLAEFACLPRPLATLVNLVFQSGDFVLLLTDGALRLGEVRGERGFLVLAFTACGLRLASRRLEVAEHLREVFPRVLEGLLEF